MMRSRALSAPRERPCCSVMRGPRRLLEPWPPVSQPLIQLASLCAAHFIVIFLRSVQKLTADGPVMSP